MTARGGEKNREIPGSPKPTPGAAFTHDRPTHYFRQRTPSGAGENPSQPPPVAGAAAAQLYHSFLLDIIEEMVRVPEVRLALAFNPPGDGGFFRGWPSRVESFPRRGRIWESAWPGPLPGGSPPVTAPSCSGAAMCRTCRTRGVRGPAGPGDGGGPGGPGTLSRRRLLPGGPEFAATGLFRGPAWSSSTVLADTLALARQSGLKVHLLPPWPDIDTYADLRTFLNRPRPAPQPGWRSREQGLKLLGRPK